MYTGWGGGDNVSRNVHTLNEYNVKKNKQRWTAPVASVSTCKTGYDNVDGCIRVADGSDVRVADGRVRIAAAVVRFCTVVVVVVVGRD